MLFRFPEIRRHCLWMKNTPLPLSAAFIDEAGRIVDLIDLEPLSVAIRCSREPARYALEVNQAGSPSTGRGSAAASRACQDRRPETETARVGSSNRHGRFTQPTSRLPKVCPKPPASIRRQTEDSR